MTAVVDALTQIATFMVGNNRSLQLSLTGSPVLQVYGYVPRASIFTGSLLVTSRRPDGCVC